MILREYLLIPRNGSIATTAPTTLSQPKLNISFKELA